MEAGRRLCVVKIHGFRVSLYRRSRVGLGATARNGTQLPTRTGARGYCIRRRFWDTLAHSELSRGIWMRNRKNSALTPED